MSYSGHIESINIIDLKLWSPGDHLMFNALSVPARRSYGHRFKIQITINFTLRREAERNGLPHPESGCKLFWYEHTTRAYSKLAAHQWGNLFSESQFDLHDPASWLADNPIWQPWCDVVHNVTAAGRQIITLSDDTPSMPLTEDGYEEEKKRILHFCIVAKCSENCSECSTGYKYVAAVQGLAVRHTSDLSKRAFGKSVQVTYHGGSPQGLDNSAWLNPFRDGVNWSHNPKITEAISDRTGFQCGLDAKRAWANSIR